MAIRGKTGGNRPSVHAASKMSSFLLSHMEHLNPDPDFFLGLARVVARPLFDAVAKVIIEWLKLRYKSTPKGDAPKQADLTASKRPKW